MQQHKKIAVFLPACYHGGSLNGAKNMAKMLHFGSRIGNDPMDIVFSCVADFYDVEKDFDDLIELGIQVRETHWLAISQKSATECLAFAGVEKELDEPDYFYPSDNIGNFNDCDFWLLISDRTELPLLPIKPYGILIYDYIQRYIPQIFGDYYERSFLTTARNAKFVLTTTPGTREDIIQYAGISEEKVHLISMEFNPIYLKPRKSLVTTNYFIWTTNCSPHKNHLTAIEALNIYYSTLNGKLNVVMTGTLTHCFEDTTMHNAHPYAKAVNERIESYPLVREHLTILGEMNTPEYINTLASAKFLWHPTLKDNGTYSVVEAAYYGIPSLSSDYPQMRFIDETFKLHLSFSDRYNAKKIAQELKRMEQEYTIEAQKLPSPEFLEQFSYKQLASQCWLSLKDLL